MYLLRDSHLVTSAQSDGNGRYAFYVTEAGTFDVVAAGNDASFLPRNGLTVGAGRILANVNSVAGNKVISGSVSSAGNPIGDALLLVDMVVTPDLSFNVGYVTTDQSGSFEYSGAVPAEYRVTVMADGYATATQQVTVGQTAGAQTDFSLQQALHVSGTVVDAGTATGVGEAIIYLIADGIDERCIAITDGSGKWSVNTLAEGVYDLVILAKGFRRAVEDLLSSTFADFSSNL